MLNICEKKFSGQTMFTALGTDVEHDHKNNDYSW